MGSYVLFLEAKKLLISGSFDKCSDAASLCTFYPLAIKQHKIKHINGHKTRKKIRISILI